MQEQVTYYSSPAGWLKLQAREDCITAISFVEEEAADGAAPVPAGSVLERCRTQLDEYFSGRRTTFDVPVRQEGTAFQQEVWRLLAAIPYGRWLFGNWLIG